MIQTRRLPVDVLTTVGREARFFGTGHTRRRFRTLPVFLGWKTLDGVADDWPYFPYEELEEVLMI